MSANTAELVRTGYPPEDAEFLSDPVLLSHFIHRIGHEIGNPLTAIIALASVIERSVPSPDGKPAMFRDTDPVKIGSSASTVIDEAWRISAINEKLVLILSRRPPNLTECSPRELLDRALTRLGSRHKNVNVDIVEPETAQSPYDLTCYADPEQLLFVFGELLLNAFRHGAEQSAGSPAAEPMKIELLMSAQAGTLVMEFRNWLGGPCSLPLDKVFEPFVTSRNEQKHVGLGLTAVWMTTKRNGGFVFIREERVDERCLFSVVLSLPTSAPVQGNAA